MSVNPEGTMFPIDHVINDAAMVKPPPLGRSSHRLNADEPQPKRINRRKQSKQRGGCPGNFFGFIIPVYSVFSVLRIFAFFATIELLMDYASFSGKLKTGSLPAALRKQFFPAIEKSNGGVRLDQLGSSIQWKKARILFCVSKAKRLTWWY